ncbi:MAG TPA: biopolymer transporter ExbD [Myxococcota bacterium]|nr:biopolymer transporter ExbD [Myxococcota bacterium]
MSLSKKTRRTTHKNLRHREDAELNLIPLIDILSVMVAFLLVYSVDVEVIQNAKGVEIPQSIAETQPKQSVVVMITKDQLFVQGEPIATLDEIRADKSPLIEPLRQVLSRPLLAGDPSAADPTAMASREITLMGDKSLPYDVVKKVMATCTAAAYGKISLAVMEKERPVHVAGAKAA